MSYRGPQPNRHFLQATDLFQHAGYTATWYQFVSASASGTRVAGFGSAYFYRQQVITGVFGNNVPASLIEKQRAAGVIAAGDVQLVSREQIGRQDRLIWRGIKYNIESDPVPSRMAGLWVTVLRRADE